MRSACAVVVVWASIVGGGCGGGASTTQPTSPTAAHTTQVDPRVVVVWPAGRQSELLQAMQEGPTLLAVDGSQVTVLGQCALGAERIGSSYTYAAAAPRQEHVSLQNRAAARSQLPEMVDTLFAVFDAELGRGDAVDVAITSMGKRTLAGAPTSVRRASVGGGPECASATHLVTGTTVGAFAIATTAAKSGGPARQIKGGNLAKCGPTGEPQCSGPLMLDLLAISP